LLPGCRYEQIWKIAMFLKGMDKLRDEPPPRSMPSGRKYPALRPLRPRNNTNTLCDRRAKQSSVAEEKLCWQVEIADLFSDKSQTDGSRSGVPNGVKQRHGGKA